MIFMISKTRIPGDHSMDPLAFSVVHQSHVSPCYIAITFFPLVFSCLPCRVHVHAHVHVHVFDSITKHHAFLFSHILPISGWHQFHARSHPNCATVIGGNATSHLGHAFAINHRQPQPPLPHPATSFVWSLSRRMIHQASNLRWQSTDMAWTSTPSRLRHGPSSSNTDPMIHPMVVCLYRALPLTRRPFYPPPVEGSHHDRGDMIQVFRPLVMFWRTAVILESPSQPGGPAARDPWLGAWCFRPDMAM